MSNVPKIVIERLKAAPSVGSHPDADVLTAFSEQALPERERGVVLEHLALCWDCRDVVALALPVREAVEIMPAPTRRGWLTWPALRWGFVAAGIVTIAAFGVLQYRRIQHPAMMSYKESPRIEVAAESRPQTPAPTAAAPAEKRDEAKIPASRTDSGAGASLGLIQPESVTRTATPPEPSHLNQFRGAAGTIGGPISHGPKMPAQWQQQNNTQQNNAGHSAAQANAPVPAVANQQFDKLSSFAPPPATSESVAVSAQTVQVDTEAKKQESPSAQDQPAAPQSLADEDSKVGKAKPAVSVEAANAGPESATGANAQQELPVQSRNYSVNGRNLNELVALSPGVVPRWTISSAGSLQRSFDQGSSWQTVDVNANSASSESLKSLTVAKSSRAKEKDADQKALKREAATPIFRAVSALGPEVWAGGSGGALYHSQDAGLHWTRVVPSSADAVLIGDILSLQFSDIRHGKVTTSAPEVWITSDAGQTWQKQ